jgi:hypothetical protein
MKVKKLSFSLLSRRLTWRSSVSARRAQCKMKVKKTFIFIAEPLPNLAKQSSARRAQCKMKVKKLSFRLVLNTFFPLVFKDNR